MSNHNKQITYRSLNDIICVPQLEFDAAHLIDQLYQLRQTPCEQRHQRNLPDLIPFHDLMQLDKALVLLTQALQSQWSIVVVGDFDADGATSTALTVLALRAMGAQHIQFLVPNRFTYGYGLTPPIVELAKQMGAELIITVDNGITSIEGVNYAKAANIRVLITDHHLPGSEIPLADAIINPNQPGDNTELKALAGVGVMYYLLIAFRRHLQSMNWFTEQAIPMPNMAEFLDLVALGTVADVVPLDHNNRILVQQGLWRMRAGKIRPGILALLRIANKEIAQLQARDLGFTVGPRLNAAGRLDDMSKGIGCLLADNFQEAWELAQLLDQLNQERQQLDRDMQRTAMQAVDTMQAQHDLPRALCLYDPNWHQGVIGIVAGRVKDRYHRPTFAFAKVAAGELKGSGRSIPGIHLRDLLQAVSAHYPHLLNKFGGHAMAAGLSLAEADLPAFQQALLQILNTMNDVSLWQQTLFIDCDLPAAYLTLDFAKQLADSGPWGAQFPEPLFRGHFTVVQQRLVAEKHMQLLLRVPGEQRCVDAIVFNIRVEEWAHVKVDRIDLVYRLQVDYFNGLERLKLVAESLEIINTLVPSPLPEAT